MPRCRSAVPPASPDDPHVLLTSDYDAVVRPAANGSGTLRWTFVSLEVRRVAIGRCAPGETTWQVCYLKHFATNYREESGIFIRGITDAQSREGALRYLRLKVPWTRRSLLYTKHSMWRSFADVLHRREMFKCGLNVTGLAKAGVYEHALQRTADGHTMWHNWPLNGSTLEGHLLEYFPAPGVLTLDKRHAVSNLLEAVSRHGQCYEDTCKEFVQLERLVAAERNNNVSGDPEILEEYSRRHGLSRRAMCRELTNCATLVAELVCVAQRAHLDGIRRPALVTGGLPEELANLVISYLREGESKALGALRIASATRKIIGDLAGIRPTPPRDTRSSYSAEVRHKAFELAKAIFDGRSPMRALYATSRSLRAHVGALPDVIPQLRIMLTGDLTPNMKFAINAASSADYFAELDWRRLVRGYDTNDRDDRCSLVKGRSATLVVAVKNWDGGGGAQSAPLPQWMHVVDLLVFLEIEMLQEESSHFVAPTSGPLLELDSSMSSTCHRMTPVSHAESPIGRPCMRLDMRQMGIVCSQISVNVVTSALRSRCSRQSSSSGGATGRFRLVAQYDEQHPAFPPMLRNSSFLRGHSAPFSVLARTPPASRAVANRL